MINRGGDPVLAVCSGQADISAASGVMPQLLSMDGKGQVSSWRVSNGDHFLSVPVQLYVLASSFGARLVCGAIVRTQEGCFVGVGDLCGNLAIWILDGTNGPVGLSG